jgi:transcriptional regulator with XRE-family HTH domain
MAQLADDAQLNSVDVVIGARVQQLRVGQGQSLASLAKALDTTVEVAHQYESGQQRLRAQQLFALAAFFNVQLKEFFQAAEHSRAAPEQLLHVA